MGCPNGFSKGRCSPKFLWGFSRVWVSLGFPYGFSIGSRGFLRGFLGFLLNTFSGATCNVWLLLQYRPLRSACFFQHASLYCRPRRLGCWLGARFSPRGREFRFGWGQTSKNVLLGPLGPFGAQRAPLGPRAPWARGIPLGVPWDPLGQLTK